MPTTNPKALVCHVVCGLHSGGVEQMILNYCAQMQEVFAFDIVYQHNPDPTCLQKFLDLGFSTHRIPSKAKNPIGNVVQNYRIFRKGKYDVIHAHMTLMNVIPCFCAILCGIPVRISHSHNVFKIRNPLALIIVSLLKLCNRVLSTDWFACGTEAGEFLWGKRAVESQKVTIIENAIHLDHFRYDVQARMRIRDEYDLQNKFCIGHIGRFSDQKNHSFLIDIFHSYHGSNKDSVLFLLGSGERLDATKEKVSALHLNDCVHFLGVHRNTQEFYSAMDLFLLPSRWEGFPVTSVEAQASGLPCLFSDTIAKDTNLSSNVTFLPLSASPAAWAETIADIRYLTKGFERTDSASKLQGSKFDIDSAVRALENRYLLK